MSRIYIRKRNGKNDGYVMYSIYAYDPLKNKKRYGQTYSYKNYFKNFKTDYFIRMDADNQDDPKYLIQISKFILILKNILYIELKHGTANDSRLEYCCSRSFWFNV